MARDVKAQKSAPVEAMATVNEELAIAIAHGCASSTFDIVLQASAGETGKLTPGRFWYCRGQQPGLSQAAEHVTQLAQFLLAHDGVVPGEALYLFASNHVAKQSVSWADLSLAERKAFEVFAATLTPLVREARADMARRKVNVPVAPPPDHGVWKRGDGFGSGPRPSFNDQPVLSYADMNKEAAE